MAKLTIAPQKAAWFEQTKSLLLIKVRIEPAFTLSKVNTLLLESLRPASIDAVAEPQNVRSEAAPVLFSANQKCPSGLGRWGRRCHFGGYAVGPGIDA